MDISARARSLATLHYETSNTREECIENLAALLEASAQEERKRAHALLPVLLRFFRENEHADDCTCSDEALHADCRSINEILASPDCCLPDVPGGGGRA